MYFHFNFTMRFRFESQWTKGKVFLHRLEQMSCCRSKCRCTKALRAVWQGRVYKHLSSSKIFKSYFADVHDQREFGPPRTVRMWQRTILAVSSLFRANQTQIKHETSPEKQTSWLRLCFCRIITISFFFNEHFLNRFFLFFTQAYKKLQSIINAFTGREDGMEHRCPNCNKSYRVPSSLRRHLKYHCGRKQKEIITGYSVSETGFQCTTCSRLYKVFGSLKRHIKYECKKQPSIPCPIVGCTYKAKIRCRMIQHVRMVHKVEL